MLQHKAGCPPPKQTNKKSAWQTVITILRKNWILPLSRALLNPLDDKSDSASHRRLFASSAERLPRGKSLFNYTFAPAKHPIPLAGSSICGSACHSQFCDTEQPVTGSPRLSGVQSSVLLFTDKNRRENKWIFRSTSVRLEFITESRHGDYHRLWCFIIMRRSLLKSF